jgi:heat shock protein HslJ
MHKWQSILFALLLLLAGCQPLTPPAGDGGAIPPTSAESALTPTVVAEEANEISTPASEDAGDPLAGTQWQLISFGASEPELPQTDETAITLAFSADGQVSGSTGCNSFGGRYQVADDTIIFSEVVSTLRACTDEAVMEREQRFLQALGAPVQFEVMGDQLVITSDTGDTLTFGRVAASSEGGTPTAEPSEA